MIDEHTPLAWRDVDLAAIDANVKALKAICATAELMAVVKADAYSHGAVRVARTALGAGATQLGVATISEGIELREADVSAPILAWVASPHGSFEPAVRHDLSLGVHSIIQLDYIAAAARATGRQAKIHLKVETGMWRGGAADEWPALVARASLLEAKGLVDVVGVWSHLACADDVDDPTTDAQRREFDRATTVALASGLQPRFRHLANSAATLTRPDLHCDMVRCGLAIYGFSPLAGRGASVPLRPALSVRARITHLKAAPAHTGVSYGHTYRTRASTRLAIVPLGYADGVPVLTPPYPAPVGYAGSRIQLAGRVCMDQFISDVRSTQVDVGDVVTILGPGADGEWTAEDWASATGRSVYDILTGFGRRRLPIHYSTDGQFVEDPAG